MAGVRNTSETVIREIEEIFDATRSDAQPRGVASSPLCSNVLRAGLIAGRGGVMAQRDAYQGARWAADTSKRRRKRAISCVR